jgi:hypothetical protein
MSDSILSRAIPQEDQRLELMSRMPVKARGEALAMNISYVTTTGRRPA